MAIDDYTEGNDWEIAVAVPVTNSRFLYPTKISSTFQNAYDTGTTGTTITLTSSGSVLTSATTLNARSGGNLVSPDYLNLYAQANDTVKFGASTDSDDSGKTETSHISSVTNAYQFVVPSTLTYNYSADDPVSITCSKFPASWYFASNEGNVNTTSRVRGRLTNYAFQWTHDVSGASDFRNNLDSNLLYATPYRAGVWFKGSRSAGGTSDFCGIHLNNGSANFINQGVDNDNDLSGGDWILVTDTGTNSVSSSTFFMQIFNGNNYSSGTDTIAVDEPFVEHSYIPSAGYTVGTAYGDASITASGYFPFCNPDNFTSYTDYESVKPDLGSLTIETYESTTEITMLNGTKRKIDMSGLGQRVEKYTINASFSNVPVGFYKVLREYERIQKDGHLLNLHPYHDLLPSTLTGFIKVSSNIKKDRWQLDLVSFNFIFIEV